MSDLSKKSCESCEGIGSTLNEAQITKLMSQLDKGWQHKENLISRDFSFDNFYETMAFLNAVAWIANKENHHPDIEAGYNYCKLNFMTHALKGLTHNDFICAAKVDSLI